MSKSSMSPLELLKSLPKRDDTYSFGTKPALWSEESQSLWENSKTVSAFQDVLKKEDLKEIIEEVKIKKQENQ